MSKDLDGIVTSWNRGAEMLFGYTADEMVGKPITLLFPLDRQDEEPQILDRIRNGQRVDHYETVRMRKDGTLVDISLTISPIRDAEGKIVGASKIARDISERRRAQDEQRFIIEEIKHRMRNTLATVQALAMQTLRASSDERNAFIARLVALGRAHDLLTVEHWNKALVIEVIEKTLAPFRNGGRDRFAVEGARDIWLDANHAVLLTMALHELATNACKYGALSNDVGRVRLQWNVLQDRPFLRLHWSESGGPAIEKQPSRVGFGSFLIERVLKVEGAGAQLDYKSEGFEGTFEIPYVAGV